MSNVKIYLTSWCPYCNRAKALLQQRGVTEMEEIDLDEQPKERAGMIQLSGRRSVPQIFINGTHVGGCDDLVELDRQGRLVPMLAAA
jgi:glutaredoxin 3